MSSSELFLILLVGLLVLRPEDIPNFFKQIRRWYNFWLDTKKSLISKIDLSLDTDKNFNSQDHEIINDYLKKISDMGSCYNGEYDLDKVQKFYEKILEESIKK